MGASWPCRTASLRGSTRGTRSPPAQAGAQARTRVDRGNLRARFCVVSRVYASARNARMQGDADDGGGGGEEVKANTYLVLARRRNAKGVRSRERARARARRVTRRFRYTLPEPERNCAVRYE